MNNDLLKKSKSLKGVPGCYLMKNNRSEIIYIGKAKDLQMRVSSYFTGQIKDNKTTSLVKHIVDFDFIITKNEIEALVLESNLIKKHLPKYNVRLRDDKSYPYIQLDQELEYPRLRYVRILKKEKGIKYFGPFVTGSNLSEVLRVINRAFKLRDCSNFSFKTRKTACLLYQMNCCSAPCIAEISKEDYQKSVDLAKQILKGKGASSIEFLEKEMFERSKNELFERAAIIRDFISVLKTFNKLTDSKNVEFDSNKFSDVISFYRGKDGVDLSIYLFREGKLSGVKNFHFYMPINENFIFEDNFFATLLQHYENSESDLPEVIILKEMENISLFEGALKQEFVYKKKIKVVKASKKYNTLIYLVTDHAKREREIRENSVTDKILALEKLKQLLSLKNTPIILECYDVAVFQGKSPTAAQVVFVDGVPKKSSYRHFNLKERPEGNNDFAMMRELIKRRIKHGDLPDLFVVDGGIAQVNQFLEILKEEEITLPVVGIAKSKVLEGKDGFKDQEVRKSVERLVIPNRMNSYNLEKHRALYKLMVSMRDEAHRFSRRLHHKVEKRRVFNFWLDEVPGIGIKTRNRILKEVDLDINELKKMSENEISNYLSVSKRVAKGVIERLKSKI